MKPPMETHRPRMNDRQVKYLTGLSSMVMSSFSRVESARGGVGAWEEKGEESGAALDRLNMPPLPMMKYVYSEGRGRDRGERK